VFRDHCTRYEVSRPTINFRRCLIASLAQSILAVAQSNFRDLQGIPIENVILLSVIPNYPDQGQVELSKEIWPTVSAIVHSVTISLESGAFLSGLLDESMQRQLLTEIVHFFAAFPPPEMPTSNECGCDSPGLPDYTESGVGSGAAAASSSLLPPTTMLSLPPPPRPYLVAPPQSQSVVPEQSSDAPRTGFLRVRRAPSARARARKPVIYLYPPSSLSDVTVALLLAPSWSFSAVYPPPQTATPSGEHQSAQSLTWAVAAEPSGTLVDKTSGAEVSYLYWEAT